MIRTVVSRQYQVRQEESLLAPIKIESDNKYKFKSEINTSSILFPYIVKIAKSELSFLLFSFLIFILFLI